MMGRSGGLIATTDNLFIYSILNNKVVHNSTVPLARKRETMIDQMHEGSSIVG